jgi:outer membrane lipoprotein-sorting protein
VCLDQETGLPSQVTIWDHQGRLWEKFAYTDIKTNVGLRDADFDPKNPAYGFD